MLINAKRRIFVSCLNMDSFSLWAVWSEFSHLFSYECIMLYLSCEWTVNSSDGGGEKGRHWGPGLPFQVLHVLLITSVSLF